MNSITSRRLYQRILVCFLTVLFPLKTLAEPVATPSPMIENDIKKQKFVTDDFKPMERHKRDKVEETVNSSINSSLYLQGLPLIQGQDGSNQFDPLFILHNHYDASGSGGVQYCDQASANEAANFACQSDPLLAHGDIKLSTLLSGAVIDTDARAAAVRWFIQNLIDPNPNTQMKDPAALKALIDDPSKNQEVVRLLALQAILSVARQPFAEMVAKRSMGASGTSVMQKMEQDAGQRYLNSDWQQLQSLGYQTQLNKKSGLEPLYDIAVLEAFRAWLEVERYKQGERIEALLATIVVELGAGTKISQGVMTQTQTPTVTPQGTTPEVPTPPTDSTTGS